MNLTVVQILGAHTFEWTDVSACDNKFKITKDGAELITISNTDPQSCTFEHKTPREATDDISRDEVGTLHTYCIIASNVDLHYESPPACVTKAVFWIGTLNVDLTYEPYFFLVVLR